MKTEYKRVLKSYGFALTTLILLGILFYGLKYSTENKTKDFIIENSKLIDIDEYKIYRIDSLKTYYESVTIRVDPDSSYTIVCWGDRDSWLWDLKKDYCVVIDIPYNRSQGIDVSKDIKILNILKNIK